MNSIKRFLLCIIIGLSALVTSTYAEEGMKFKPISTPWKSYEVKSDIINFDYQQMAYPVQNVQIGINDKKTVAPAKREPGVAEDKSCDFSVTDCINHLTTIIFACFTALSLPVLISIILSFVAKHYEKRNMEN